MENITVRVGGHKKLDPERIIYLEGYTNYTKIHLKDGSRLTVATTLKILESRLVSFGFFRVHKSSLINLDYVKVYDANRSVLELTNSRMVVLSRRKNKTYQEMQLLLNAN